MNTTEILNKSLAWLYYKERKTTGLSRDFSHLSQVTTTCKNNQVTGYDLCDKNNWVNNFGSEFKWTSNYQPEAPTFAQVAPQELFILTQVILNTLNTEPERFHDMTEIPDMECHTWTQLGEVALYLLKQGWIEAKATTTGFLIKLSIPGKIYLGNNEALA